MGAGNMTRRAMEHVKESLSGFEERQRMRKQKKERKVEDRTPEDRREQPPARNVLMELAWMNRGSRV